MKPLPHGRGSVRLICAALILANILWFAHRGFASYFSPDDMMNMDGYWSAPWWKLVGSQVVFFSSFYRPLGALFYLPLFRMFGFNPLPYHVVLFLVMLANTYLVYRVARTISGSELAAGLAAFLVSFHAGISDVYYSPAVNYDILCFFFYFLALNWYLDIRARGAMPSVRQMAGIAVLYICALNAKEMGVTFPVVLLAYELCFHRPKIAFRAVALMTVLTALFVAGKMLGPDSLQHMTGYAPKYTLAQYFKSSGHHLWALTCGLWHFDSFRVLLVWAVALALALARKRPDLRFAWCFVLAAPLPVAFIDRSHSCLYLPLAAWSIYIGTALVWLSRWAGNKLSMRYRFAPLVWLIPVAAIGYFVHAYFMINERGRPDYEKSMADMGAQTREVIEALRSANVRVKPRSKVLFVEDPFPDWDMVFIGHLWFRDPTVTIWSQNKTPLPPKEIAGMDYVLRFDHGKLVQVKPDLSGSPARN